MSIWTEPSPSDFDRWEALVIEGKDPSTAARQLGFAGSSTFKRSNPRQHGEVLQTWREQQQADDRTTARDTLREVATDDAAPHAARVTAATTLARASGYLTDKAAIELSGPDGGPIEHEGRSTSLAAVVRVLADVGALVELGIGTAGGSLPAAPAALAEPAKG